MTPQDTNAPAVDQQRLVRRFRVRGICLVPTEVEIEIEAPNARAAVMMAQRSDWKSRIGANDGDTGAAFDWEPTAEEINPANSVVSTNSVDVLTPVAERKDKFGP